MKRTFKTAWIVVGLCLVAPLLAAQDQSVESHSKAAEDRQAAVDKLEERLARVRAELAALRQQLANSATSESTASSRAENLQKRAELLSVDLSTARKTPDEAAGHAASGAALAGTRFVQVQRKQNLSVELTADHGDFMTGKNNFCLDFKSVRDGSLLDAGDVSTEFTQSIGRVKAVRALARVTQIEIGRYCGDVNLPTRGAWLITATYVGASGKGKALFAPTVR